MFTALLFVLVNQVHEHVAQDLSSPYFPQNDTGIARSTEIWINVMPANGTKEINMQNDQIVDIFKRNSDRHKNSTGNIKRHNITDSVKTNYTTKAGDNRNLKDPIKLHKHSHYANFTNAKSKSSKKEVKVKTSKNVSVHENYDNVENNINIRRILWSKISNKWNKEKINPKNLTKYDDDMQPLVLKTQKDYDDDAGSLVLNSEKRTRYSNEYEDSLGPLAIKPQKNAKDLSGYEDIFRPSAIKPKKENMRDFVDYENNITPHKPLAMNHVTKGYNRLDMVSQTSDSTQFKLTDPVRLGPDSYFYGILLINNRADPRNKPNYRLNAAKRNNKREAQTMDVRTDEYENSLDIENKFITADNDGSKQHANYYANEDKNRNDPTNKVIGKSDTLLNGLKLIPNFERTHNKYGGKKLPFKVPFVVLDVVDDSLSDEDTYDNTKKASNPDVSYYDSKAKDYNDPNNFDHYRLPLKTEFFKINNNRQGTEN